MIKIIYCILGAVINHLNLIEILTFRIRPATFPALARDLKSEMGDVLSRCYQVFLINVTVLYSLSTQINC